MSFSQNNPISKFTIHTHVYKSLKNNRWYYVLEIYPLNDDLTISDPLLIPSQVDFCHYEYALESALEIFELLGFEIYEKVYFEVYGFKEGRYIKSIIVYSNESFESIDEVEITEQEYNNIILGIKK